MSEKEAINTEVIERIKQTNDNNNIGIAGEYYIASLLSYYGCVTTITLGRAKLFDILAVTPNNKSVKIQVKTTLKKDKKRMLFTSSAEDPKNIQNNLFYVFVKYIPENMEYWVINSIELAEYSKYIDAKWHSGLKKDGTLRKHGTIRNFHLKMRYTCPEDWPERLNSYYKNIGKILNYNK